MVMRDLKGRVVFHAGILYYTVLLYSTEVEHNNRSIHQQSVMLVEIVFFFLYVHMVGHKSVRQIALWHSIN